MGEGGSEVVNISEVESESSEDEGSSSESELETEEKTKVVSLLDKLKPAKLSKLARARKQKRNKPPVGACRSRGCSVSNAKSVPPSQRVQEFSEYNCSK